jgi:hypothetical protein
MLGGIEGGLVTREVGFGGIYIYGSSSRLGFSRVGREFCGFGVGVCENSKHISGALVQELVFM